MSPEDHTPIFLTKAVWRASSCSGRQGNCLRAAVGLPGALPIRDSRRPAGLRLDFSHQA
ncbi:DUF397 domain-containing protein [Streptomyces poonensis]|uniref:DUF397 domain-containing protein n=1 Tax=Streptomyces poonensis TaxID=68255 RepID=UPI00167435F9|nr:DUF397 domain-containing protein [Streptomyces poonensis]